MCIVKPVSTPSADPQFKSLLHGGSNSLDDAGGGPNLRRIVISLAPFCYKMAAHIELPQKWLLFFVWGGFLADMCLIPLQSAHARRRHLRKDGLNERFL